MTKFLQRKYHTQSFTLCCRIIAFGTVELSTGIASRMVDFVIGLGKDGANCYRRGIDMHMEGYRPIRELENRGFDQFSLEQLKGLMTVLRLVELDTMPK